MTPEIIRVPELAKLMGRSESSIRSAIANQADWMPPYFKQGRSVCWRLESVRAFLAEYEQGMHSKPRLGRKRETPPTLRRA